MSRSELRHQYDVVLNTKDEVKKCLFNISDCDLDFNGENGSEYLWEEAEGFESNSEYCMSIAQQEPTTKDMIKKFISLWMGRDYYYEDYDLGVIVMDNYIFISLAYTIEC